MSGGQRSGDSTGRRRVLLALGLFAILGAVVAVGAVVAGTGADPAAAATTQQYVSEEEFTEPVPEEGDSYFEAVADDDSWISYINPRDEYRMPYLGEGSGKMCVMLVNEAGDPVDGESVPDTTVTVPTGESLEWHGDVDPFVVEYPLTDNYVRPLDSDQFGTDPDLPQGDGYLDTHCFEWHGLPENETVEYGEVEIEGEHDDQIELVGYIQHAHETWETDIDPLDAAESYEEAGGGWTYHPDGSHGQMVAVLQLDGDADIPVDDDDGDDDDTDGGNGADADDEGGTGDGDDDTVPGFGTVVALVALLVATVGLARRRG